MRNPDTTRHAFKVIGITLLCVGAGLVVLSLAADVLGIGGGEGFGYQQLIVLIVGIMLILGGLGVILQPLLGTPAARAQRDVFDMEHMER